VLSVYLPDEFPGNVFESGGLAGSGERPFHDRFADSVVREWNPRLAGVDRRRLGGRQHQRDAEFHGQQHVHVVVHAASALLPQVAAQFGTQPFRHHECRQSHVLTLACRAQFRALLDPIYTLQLENEEVHRSFTTATLDGQHHCHRLLKLEYTYFTNCLNKTLL